VRYILAIDQGTTNAKALAMTADGAVVARASRPVEVTFPRPGWVEQSAEALSTGVLDAARDCIAQAGGVAPAAIGVTNQRESILAWERATGRPAGPCISWQCRRTVEMCERLRADGVEPLVARKTGLTLDPLFSATKARWLLESIPNGQARASAGELCLGTVDSWVAWTLNGGAAHVCDATNASRTQLCDLATGAWDEELLGLFGVPRAALPEIRPSSGIAAVTSGTDGIPAGVPIASLIGDSHAALFGHAAFRPGAVKATYGTGSSLMTPTSSLARAAGLSSTIAWAFADEVQYALEGNITDTGGAVDWIGRLLGSDQPDVLVASLAATVGSSGGVYLVPAFAGLGAPHWDAYARGVIVGLTRGTTAAHVARAAIESIAYQVDDILEAIHRDSGITLRELRVDGGASMNEALMQFQSDLLGVPVVRPEVTETTALGAAYLAGLAVGFWSSVDEIAGQWRVAKRFDPVMPRQAAQVLRDRWHDALDRARGWAKPEGPTDDRC
jgi:glycerol kinase